MRSSYAKASEDKARWHHGKSRPCILIFLGYRDGIFYWSKYEKTVGER